MKAIILYRPNSEHARKVEEFLSIFGRLHPGKETELISLDTREGSATAALYDIVQYPAVAAIQDNGSALKIWQGDQLPLMDEVAAYL